MTNDAGRSDFPAAVASLVDIKPEAYKALFEHVDASATVEGMTAQFRFHFLKFDGNARPRMGQLARTLVNHLIYYAHEARRYRDINLEPHEIFDLGREAVRAMRKRNSSGEAGEVLLYFLLEAVLEAPQMVAKISLKTNPKMEVHGSDGIHAKWNPSDQVLDIYLGEAKIYKRSSHAIGAACRSLRNFVKNEQERHELSLLTTHYKHADAQTKSKILDYVEGNASAGTFRVNHVLLIGFDFEGYQRIDKMDHIKARAQFIEAYRHRSEGLAELFAEHVNRQQLQNIRFDVFFLPFPSVSAFRRMFQKEAGGLVGH